MLVLLSRGKDFFRGIAVGTYAGLFQQVASAIAAVMVLPVAGRQLGAAAMGAWLGMQSMVMFAGLADFGFGAVLSRQTAFCLGALSNKRGSVATALMPISIGWSGVAQAYTVARQLNRAAAALAAFGLMALGFGFVSSSGIAEVAGRDFAALWLIFSFTAVVQLLARPDAALLEGAGDFAYVRVTTGLQQLVGLGSAAIVAYCGGRLVAMSIAVLLASLANNLALNLRVRTYSVLGDERKNTSFSCPLALAMLKVALPFGGVNVGGALFSAVQVPYIAASISPTFAAAYYVAQRIAISVNAAILQFVFPQLPKFSSLLAAGCKDEAYFLMRRNIRHATTLIIIGASTWSFAYYYTSKRLFSVDPLPYPVLTLMVLDVTILHLAVIWSHYVLASGSNPFLWTTLVTGILNIVCLALLSPHLGITTVPLASLIAGSLVSYWYSIFLGNRILNSLKPQVH